MRILPALAAFALLAAPAFADHHAKTVKVKTVPAPERLPAHEPDTYRFGYPYNAMRGTTPGQCEQMCNRDDSCAAWSLTPATFEVGPRCELKRSVGSASFRPGAVSGISRTYQPDPVRTGPMRYKPKPPPEIAQPAPRRVEPKPARSMNELLGGPTRVTSSLDRPSPRTVVRPAPTPLAPKVYRGPGEGAVPNYVKQPAPVTAPAAAPAPRPAPVIAPAPAPMPSQPSSVLKRPAQAVPAQTPPGPPPPARVVPQFQMVPDAPAAAAPAPVATAPLTSPGGVQIDPPAPLPNRRKPWTERMSGTPDYSVGDGGYVPGDEEATAGFVEGAPEGEE